MSLNKASEVLEEIGRLQQRLDELKASLKQELVRDAPPKGEMELFVCLAHGELFGLPVAYVDEVLPMCKLAVLPEAPPWIAGLLNFRGSSVPVIDLTGRMERQSRSAELEDFLVVCSYNDQQIGLVIQGVSRIHIVDAALLQPVAREVRQAPYVHGVFQLDGRAIFLLSLSCLLATSDIPEEAW